jgi:hypothetical protein
VTAARLLAVLTAALALAPAAAAAPASPTGLHGFVLTAADAEQPTHTFSRTPAFSWDRVPGTDHYEFQLSTSKTFAENAVVWESTSIGGPLTTVPLTLPWISGAKYSWFARVRAVANDEEGPWSGPYGFNMRPGGAPRSLSNGNNPNPGMIRWTPVDGATSYEVVFLFDQSQGKLKTIKTATTAADLREFYTFHNTYPSAIFWRVRAIREVEGATKNALPVVSYGPWSAHNRTVEPAFSTDALQLQGSISRSGLTDVEGTTTYPGAHQLLPGFWWTGSRSPAPELLGACPTSILALIDTAGCPLFHIYVYTDADCVNRVYVSDLVGSPAFVPRLTPPLALPSNPTDLSKAASMYLPDGAEGKVYDAGGNLVVPSGAATSAATPSTVPPDNPDTSSSASGSNGSSSPQTGSSSPSSGSSSPSSGSSSPSSGSSSNSATGTSSPSSSGTSSSTTATGASSGTSSTTTGSTSPEAAQPLRKSGLWDNDWPTSRYYWVVVPAVPYLTQENAIEYHDVAFPEDLCAAGNVMTFGKTSAAVSTSSAGVPYASGLSPQGDLVAAMTADPAFFGKPVVAWQPAPGAQRYEIQWSKKDYPWRAVGNVVTGATTAQLDLPVGHWYYRVRGLDNTLPGAAGLTWSDVAELSIEPRTFQVVSKSKLKATAKARAKTKAGAHTTRKGARR